MPRSLERLKNKRRRRRRFLTETHLGHGTGFVRKYVLDLSEFFVQRRGPGLSRGPRLFVVHFFVPVYEKALHETHHLDAAERKIRRYNERENKSRFVRRKILCPSTHTHTHLTYREIGTSVLRTMAYEKNTSVPMVMAPDIRSDGTSESHGRYVWKYQPVLYSQTTDPIIQDKQSRNKNNTICGKSSTKYNY